MLWTLGLVGVVIITSRLAVARGRSGVGWGALSVAAAIFGILFAAELIRLTVHLDASQLLVILASLVAPLFFMLVVIVLLMNLAESVPTLRGKSWPMHRLSTPEHPGGACVLSIDNGRLLVGSELAVAPQELTDIAADGECLRLAWPGQTVLLRPAGEGLTNQTRAKRSLALEQRIRSLRG